MLDLLVERHRVRPVVLERRIYHGERPHDSLGRVPPLQLQPVS